MLGLLLGMIVGPLTAALIAISGFWPISATPQPPTWETTMARHALDASVSREAPRLRNPLPANEETLLAGLKMYRDGCAGCHGAYQKPSHWGTTAFYPRVPQFGSEPTTKPDWQMFWIVKNGIRYSGMAAWDGEISDERIWQWSRFWQICEHCLLTWRHTGIVRTNSESWWESIGIGGYSSRK
jgi:thiosulfate dehydrogenase